MLKRTRFSATSTFPKFKTLEKLGATFETLEKFEDKFKTLEKLGVAFETLEKVNKTSFKQWKN